MFNRKSDYALNKREKNAIIYKSVTNCIRLTPADFSNKNEFLKWKDWSNGDYEASEQVGRGFYDNAIPFNEKLEALCATPSVEEELFSRLEETEHRWLSTTLTKQIMRRLTEKQYRRLWLYYVKNLSESEIAAIEHVGQQRVSKSILASKKIIEKFFK